MNTNQINVRAEFNIEKGKIEEFKKLIWDMSRMVENNEPDTINYQFYLNRSETKCMVHETYTNSESILAHVTGGASKTILPKIFNISQLIRSQLIRFDVYGNPSEELQKVLTSFDSQLSICLQDSVVKKLNHFFRTAWSKHLLHEQIKSFLNLRTYYRLLVNIIISYQIDK